MLPGAAGLAGARSMPATIGPDFGRLEQGAVVPPRRPQPPRQRGGAQAAQQHLGCGPPGRQRHAVAGRLVHLVRQVGGVGADQVAVERTARADSDRSTGRREKGRLGIAVAADPAFGASGGVGKVAVSGRAHQVVDVVGDHVGRLVGGNRVGVDTDDPPQLGGEGSDQRRPDRDSQRRGQVEHSRVVGVLVTGQPARRIVRASHVDGRGTGVGAQRSGLRVVLNLQRPARRR